MAGAAEILISIVGKSTGYKRALNEAKQDTTKFGSFVQGIFQGIGQAAFNAATTGIRAAAGEIAKSIRAASDLSETLSKANTVFGKSSAAVRDWSKESATAFGLSQKAALDAASSLGNMFQQMGAGERQTVELSVQMVRLSADIASFHNVAGGAEEVLNDMSSAFRGEYDPIQKYIPLINAAAVEQQALADTGKSAAKELTALEKAVAVQTLIMRGAGAAAGDFARTIDGVANQERILAAQLENARAQLGQAFTPIYGEILRGLNLLVGQVSEYGTGIVQALATGLVNGVIYILPALATIRDIITYWLKPGSPPRILPDIDKWMTETINVWLSGASKADFGILRGLGGSIESILRSFVGTGQIKETDLVSRIFGSQAAIVRAVTEWRTLGRVTQSTMDAIRRSAGPAGDSVAGLVESYFDLQRASQAAARAQEELTRVTTRYDAILSPLQSRLDDLTERQQDLRDQQRKAELGELLRDPEIDASTKRLAQYEIEEINLRDRMQAIEEERDVAVDAEQQKLDAAKKQEDAVREQYETQEAQLEQQLKTNQLIGEEVTLRERLANEALAKQEQALRELEQAQREAERAQKAAQAEAQRHAQELERLYQAQLQYNLSTADTPGKLALLKLELSRYTEGSVEYWQILTQIAGLEEQLRKEREKGGGGAGGLIPPVLPSIDDLEIPDWVKELQATLRREIDKWFGEEPDFGFSLKGGSVIDQIMGPKPESGGGISQDVKDFADSVEQLATSFTNAIPSIESIATSLGALAKLLTGDGSTAWELYKDAAVKNMEETKTEGSAKQRQTAEGLVRYLTLIDNLIDKDWGGTWQAYMDLQKTALDNSIENTRERLGWLMDLFPKADGEPTDSTSPLTNLPASGAAIINLLSGGMLARFIQFQIDWIRIAQWIRDMLPGSEPKNTDSPLYGLEDAGSAILNNIWDGLKSTWSSFSDWWTEKMGWILDQIPSLPSWMGGSSLTPSFNSPGLGSGGSFGVGASVPNLAGISSNSTSTKSITFAPGSVVVNLANGSPAEVSAAAGLFVDSVQAQLRARGE